MLTILMEVLRASTKDFFAAFVVTELFFTRTASNHLLYCNALLMTGSCRSRPSFCCCFFCSVLSVLNLTIFSLVVTSVFRNALAAPTMPCTWASSSVDSSRSPNDSHLPSISFKLVINSAAYSSDLFSMGCSFNSLVSVVTLPSLSCKPPMILVVEWAPGPLAGILSKASVMALVSWAISGLGGVPPSMRGNTRCTVVMEGCGTGGGAKVSEGVSKNEKELCGWCGVGLLLTVCWCRFISCRLLLKRFLGLPRVLLCVFCGGVSMEKGLSDLNTGPSVLCWVVSIF